MLLGNIFHHFDWNVNGQSLSNWRIILSLTLFA
ncbi:hypothetical protein P23_3307 [Acinetobacter calcoaceticus]|nr:hypothetical protein P23_3307 [Acinetobacter calcoaceticus]